MRYCIIVSVFWVMAAVMTAAPAHAISLGNILQPDAQSKEIEPPKGDVPLPKPESPPEVQTGFFPDLPPSTTCPAPYIFGLWELQHVYESPPGSELAAYNANPVQYIGFGKDTRFYKYNAGNVRMHPEVVLRHMKNHTGGVMQYLLEEAGMLYFYQDSVAVETKVCFIVTDTLPPFPAGNMLLMPPKGTTASRLVKEYKKVWPKPAKAAPMQGNQFPGQRGR